MKIMLLALVFIAQAATVSIAAAHEAAANCREADKGVDVCNKALQAACTGLAIGKSVA